MPKTDADMTQLTIRVRTQAERKAIAECKRATGRRTASQAMLRATLELPRLRQDLADARRRIGDLEHTLDRLVHLQRRAANAQVDAREAADALDEALAALAVAD